MEVKGKVVAVHGIKEISDKFKVCDLWLDTIEDYPQQLSIQLSNERAEKAHSELKKGDEVTLSINIKGREYDKKDGSGKGRFTSIEAWKWELLNQSTPENSTPEPPSEEQLNDDDLPF